MVKTTNKQDISTMLRHRYWGTRKILRLLRIIKEYISDKNRTTKTEILEEIILIVLALVLVVLELVVMLKSMVLNPGWFDSDWMKFEDW